MKILSEFLKFLLFVADWKVLVRKFQKKASFDVVFISNMRDEADQLISHGHNLAGLDHVGGVRVSLGGISGRMRVLNLLPEVLNDGNLLSKLQRRRRHINANRQRLLKTLRQVFSCIKGD